MGCCGGHGSHGARTRGVHAGDAAHTGHRPDRRNTPPGARLVGGSRVGARYGAGAGAGAGGAYWLWGGLALLGAVLLLWVFA